MQTKLFGQMTRTDVVLPDEYEAVGKAYQDMAVAGRCEDETRRRLFVAGRDMMARGVDAVALAGTDLLLALDGRDPGFPVVDALEIHAGRGHDRYRLPERPGSRVPEGPTFPPHPAACL
jgi:aspartate racemase